MRPFILTFLISIFTFAAPTTKPESSMTLGEIQSKLSNNKERLEKMGLKTEDLKKAAATMVRLDKIPILERSPEQTIALNAAENKLKDWYNKDDGKKFEDLRSDVISIIEENNKMLILLDKTLKNESTVTSQKSAETTDSKTKTSTTPSDSNKESTSSTIEVQANNDKAQVMLEDLDRIENQYDNHEMGAYIADKMAQFMNSTSFCKAKNHCSNPSTENPVDPSILYKEIFPNITNENRKRKDGRTVYDKVHKKPKLNSENDPNAGDQ